jgi:xanthine dehydrogenase accessory factor
MSLLDFAQELTRARKPFVLATVVWCERPTSAKPGAQALIQEDGQITGWIGGSCAQPVVIREAQRVLHEGGDAYLLRLGAQDTGIVRNDVRVFPMTCTSGGVLDIYIEPHLPLPQLVLVGDSPVIVALSKLASVLDFAVIQLNSPDLTQIEINERTFIVVATHGQYDEDALEHALSSSASYVGMVASRRRADECRNYLRTSGIPEKQLARLQAPAGVNIGAVTPEEIAASILAELVRVRRQQHVPSKEHAQVAEEAHVHVSELESDTQNEIAIDPVCGMTVEIANTQHHVTYDGREFYFCCPACKRHFERNPQEYLVKNKS